MYGDMQGYLFILYTVICSPFSRYCPKDEIPQRIAEIDSLPFTSLPCHRRPTMYPPLSFRLPLPQSLDPWVSHLL